ncbi:MAG TPA: MBL fold metallo-hydrolase [Anaerolineales bacterium]|nr:MBL fold metallo-hydrolase [Anaerolineales bacterium]
MNHKPSPAVFRTSGGATIHRIPLEAFPNFWAYVYLVQKDDLRVLIDCGSGTETSHENLLSGLARLDVHPSDLTHILLTHAHIDHFGGLVRLKPLTNAKIGIHELDRQTVAHHEARLAIMERRLASFLTDAGLAAETRETLLGIYRFTKAIYKSVPVDFTYSGVNHYIDIFDIIHLPGHCPGHVALRLDDVVFIGDMVVNGMTTHLSPELLSPATGIMHYLESLARLQTWSHGARLFLNGHDDALDELSVPLEATTKNLLRRLKQTLSALSEPHTTAEVCQIVYGETGGYNHLLVIEKTGAYIEYLYEHGLIEIANANEVEQGVPPRYQRLNDEKTAWEEIERKINVCTDVHMDV